MDTASRIEAAKTRLETQKAVLIRARDAGPPCIKCRWFVPPKSIGPGGERYYKPEGPFCGHLANSKQMYDPVTGKLYAKIDVPPQQARSDDGVCGFEATLFEAKGHPAARLAMSIVDVAGKIWGFAFFYFVSSFFLWWYVFKALGLRQ